MIRRRSADEHFSELQRDGLTFSRYENNPRLNLFGCRSRKQQPGGIDIADSKHHQFLAYEKVNQVSREVKP